MPTLTFFLYLLAVGAAYLLRLSYLGWFGPYFLAAVIVLPPFASLLSLPAMLVLRAETGCPITIVRGSEAHLRIDYRLPRWLPPCRVILRAEIENRYTGERYSYQEESRDPAEEPMLLRLPAELCGQLRCRVTRIECRDLAGLFFIRRKLPEERICTVLPCAVAPDASPDLDSVLETSPVLRPKYGGGFSEDHELREYRPGDTANTIHWKLSSKTDKLIVREALERQNDKIYVFLSRVGAGDRGLEVLFWLSCELCRRELPHLIVADRVYAVSNEREIVEALVSLLSAPLGEPVRCDVSDARCVLRVLDGEVRLL